MKFVIAALLSSLSTAFESAYLSKLGKRTPNTQRPSASHGRSDVPIYEAGGGGSMGHFAPEAGFVGKDTSAKAAGGSSAPDWLAARVDEHRQAAGAVEAAPAKAKAAPAKVVGDSMGRFESLGVGPLRVDSATDFASTAGFAKALDGGSMEDLERGVKETQDRLRRLKATQAVVAEAVEQTTQATAKVVDAEWSVAL